MGRQLRRPAMRVAVGFALVVAVGSGLVVWWQDPTPPVGGALQVANANVARLVDQAGLVHDDVQVAAGEQLDDDTVLFAGSGRSVAAERNEPVRLPALPDTARLVVGYARTGAVTGTAVQVPLSTLPPAPVVVDYISTAFARLVTTVPFATSDPLELLILRGLADSSPHLSGLAKRMQEHADAAPRTFWFESTPAEEREMSALVVDILTVLRSSSGQAQPSAADAGPQIRFAFQQQASSAFAACNAADVEPPSADPPMEPETNTGLCLFPHRNPDGSYEIDAVNHGPSWVFVYSGQPSDLPVPLAIVRPTTHKLPGVHDLAQALVSDVATANFRLAVAFGCRGWSLFGGQCAPNLEVKDLKGVFVTLKDEWQRTQKGKMSFHLDADSAQQPLGVMTGGLGGATDVPPPGVPGERLQMLTEVAYACSVVTQAIVPAAELILGLKVDEPGGVGKHRREDPVADRLFSALVDAFDRMEGDGEFTKVLADLRSGELTQLIPGLAGFVAQLATSPEFLSALMLVVVPDAPEALRDALPALGEQLVAMAVPGVGWVYAVIQGAEIVLQSVGLTYGLWYFGRDLPSIYSTGRYAALIQPPAPPSSAAAPPADPPPAAPIDPRELPTAEEWARVVRLDCSNALGPAQVSIAGYGDITRDGAPEAFLVSECEASTSSWPQVLSVYDGAAGAVNPRRIATLLDYDDGVDDRGLREIDLRQTPLDTLVADSVAYAPDDGSCCPSLTVTDRWSWDGTQYRRGPRETNQAGVGD